MSDEVELVVLEGVAEVVDLGCLVLGGCADEAGVVGMEGG